MGGEDEIDAFNELYPLDDAASANFFRRTSISTFRKYSVAKSRRSSMRASMSSAPLFNHNRAYLPPKAPEFENIKINKFELTCVFLAATFSAFGGMYVSDSVAPVGHYIKPAMGNISESQLGLLGSIVFLPSLVSSMLTAPLMDAMGVLQFGLVCNLWFMFFTLFMPFVMRSYPAIMALRFFLGVLTQPAWLVQACLVNRYAPAKHAALLLGTAMSIATSANLLGYFIIPPVMSGIETDENGDIVDPDDPVFLSKLRTTFWLNFYICLANTVVYVLSIIPLFRLERRVKKLAEDKRRAAVGFYPSLPAEWNVSNIFLSKKRYRKAKKQAEAASREGAENRPMLQMEDRSEITAERPDAGEGLGGAHGAGRIQAQEGGTSESAAESAAERNSASRRVEAPDKVGKTNMSSMSSTSGEARDAGRDSAGPHDTQNDRAARNDPKSRKSPETSTAAVVPDVQEAQDGRDYLFKLDMLPKRPNHLSFLYKLLAQIGLPGDYWNPCFTYALLISCCYGCQTMLLEFLRAYHDDIDATSVESYGIVRSVASILGGPLMGLVINKVGHRPLINLIAFVLGIAAFVMLIFTGKGWAYIPCFLLGFLDGTSSTVSMSLLPLVVKPVQVSQAFAISESLVCLVELVLPPISGWVSELMVDGRGKSIGIPFFFALVLAIGLIPSVLLLARDKVAYRGKLSWIPGQSLQ